MSADWRAQGATALVALMVTAAECRTLVKSRTKAFALVVRVSGK